MVTPASTVEDVLLREFSDADLENAGGMSGAAQAGTSLYSTSNASGCTC